MQQGDTARLKQPEIKGKVIQAGKVIAFDGEVLTKDDSQILLEWTGEDGETHRRWFSADQLELV